MADNSESVTCLRADEMAFLHSDPKRCKCGHLQILHPFVWTNMGGDNECLVCSCPFDEHGEEPRPAEKWERDRGDHTGHPFRNPWLDSHSDSGGPAVERGKDTADG